MISVNVFRGRLSILDCMDRRFFILFCLGILLALPFKSVHAASTVDCHCFRDRSFSPENPRAFDPYLLATVQNRLLAYSFDLSRKEIVGQKMSGASGDHLWVAHWMASVSGLEVNDLQGHFGEKGSWRAVVSKYEIDPEQLGADFMAALAKDDSHQLAWAVVTQVLVTSLSVSSQDLMQLRRAGASLKEAILVSLLALIKKDNSMALFEEARRNGNWGSVSIASGTNIENIDGFLAKHFSKKSQ